MSEHSIETTRTRLVLQPNKRRETLVRPQSGGMIERWISVGGGLAIAYTFAATVPIAAAGAIAFVGLQLLNEITKFQSPERAKRLKAIFDAGTVRHHSIEDLRRAGVLKLFPAHAVNQAIDEMLDHCCLYDLTGSGHPLSPYGVVYCYCDPITKQVMLPVDGLFSKLARWGYDNDYEPSCGPIINPEDLEDLEDDEETIEAHATAVEEVEPAITPDPESVPTDIVQKPTATAKQKQTAADLLARGMTFPLQPQLILGAPGSGKGVYVAVSLAKAVRKVGAEVWVIDPKADPKEAGYWVPVTRHYLKSPLADDPNFARDILAIVAEFAQKVNDRRMGNEPCDKPLILFIDEVNMVADRMQKLAPEFGSKVLALISQARSQNASIWLGGQSPILELLGIKGAANRDIFDKVVCVKGSQTTKARTILRNLEIDPNLLDWVNPAKYYWVTPDDLIDAPEIPEIPARTWGKNVIDLQPKRSQDISQTPQVLQVSQERSGEGSEVGSDDDAPLPTRIEKALLDHKDDERMCRFLTWIGKTDRRIRSLRQFTGSRWAEDHKMQAQDVCRSFLSGPVIQDFIIEIAPDEYQTKLN